MIRFMALHRASKVWCRVILCATSDYCIAENFPAPLPHFFGFLCRTAPLDAPQHIQKFKWFDFGDWFFANVREHIFVEGFEDV